MTKPTVAQTAPTRLVASLATPLIDEAGRPVMLIASAPDGDYDHLAIWRAWLIEAKKPESFATVRLIGGSDNNGTVPAPDTLATGNIKVDGLITSTSKVKRCPVDSCLRDEGHLGEHRDVLTASDR